MYSTSKWHGAIRVMDYVNLGLTEFEIPIGGNVILFGPHSSATLFVIKRHFLSGSIPGPTKLPMVKSKTGSMAQNFLPVLAG